MTVWQAVSASQRGAQHDRRSLPNQDAVRTLTVDGPVPAVVAAVADGHGGDRYVRSDVGAQAAVAVATATAAELLPRLADGRGKGLERVARSVLVPTVVERWRARVLEDRAARPFTDGERERAGAGLDDQPTVAYGATLLLAVATDEWILLVQIGDGDILAVDGDGRTAVPVPDDDRLAGGQTTSLCLPTALDDARVAVLGAAQRTELVVLSTDGYGNAFAEPSWRDRVGGDFQRQVRRLGVEAVGRDLPRWLADSARVGGDDVTMALLARPPVAAATAAPAAGRAGHRLPVLALVTVVALAAGATAGWFLRGDSSGAAPAPTTVPTTAPAPTTTVPTTAPVPTTTTTTIPLAVAGPFATIWSGDQLVLFRTDRDYAVQIASPGARDTDQPAQVVVGDRRWTLTDDGAVKVGPAGGVGTTSTITVEFAIGGMRLVGGEMWVVDTDATQLAAIVVSTEKPQEGRVPVQAPATATQEGNSPDGG